ncbi:hypothetical protein F5883DRAFT_720283 [Diaporthe sp. PMI_573]|nr:hypothetical protein F5883DRAFT_720283 [Diaporthaceae sp. PMI_573]
MVFISSNIVLRTSLSLPIPQPGETCAEDNTDTIPPLCLEDFATFDLAQEVASWYDTNRNPSLEWDDTNLQSALGKLTHAVETSSLYSSHYNDDSNSLEKVHSLFRDMLISYHELLESMKPPEFTTLPNLVYQHNGEVSVALVAQAIDGLTRTYGTRFPEDAEPLRADFTAWLAFVGLELEKRGLDDGEDDEYEDEQNGEKDDERSDRSGGESLATANGKKELIVATPFSEWLATRQVTANAKGLDDVTAKFTKRCYGEIGSNLGLLLAQKMTSRTTCSRSMA